MLISLVGYWGLALPVGVAFGFGLLGLPEYGRLRALARHDARSVHRRDDHGTCARMVAGNDARIRALASI